MKKKVLWLSLLLSLILTGSVYGAPAAPVVHRLWQADGSFFLARMWGDERSAGWETISGHTIIYDKGSGNWVYAQKDAYGQLTKSEQFVIEGEPASIIIERHIRPASSSGEDAEGRGPSFSPSYLASYPSSGAINVPVILINYNNTATTYTQADIDDVVFGDPSTLAAHGSVKNYFEEVSYDILTFNGIVNDWVQSDSDHDYFGCGSLVNPDSTKAAELVLEAVTKADAGFDFSAYDSDDGVVIIHQGTGTELSADITDIWSHKWSLSEAGLTPPTLDGVVIDDYIIVPEILDTDGQITTVGIICHEFGHLLGLPDLYDTDDSSYGIGNWGTMGTGNWNYIDRLGDCPAHCCAWSKFQLQWNTPVTEITPNTPLMAQTILAAAVHKDVYNFDADLKAGGASGEHFMLENRQQIGFDTALPGAGLLIWHIDDDEADNDNESHKLVDLEEADGNDHLDDKTNQGDDGDPYPGSANNFNFNLRTTPDNARYEDSESSQVRIEDITVSDTSIIADLYFNNDPTLSNKNLSPASGDTSTSFTFTVEYLDDDDDAPYNYYHIYIDSISNFMTKTSGDPYDGTYTCSTTLAAGGHNYYFYFEDGQGASVRLLPSGTYSGPTVSEPEENGEEEEWKSFAGWDSGCFIATATYGSPMAEEVKVLCRFRDSYLLSHLLGRKAVALYYRVSPPIASFISQHPWLKRYVRGMLKPVVKLAKWFNPRSLWSAETGKEAEISLQKALGHLATLNLNLAYKRLEVILRDFPQTKEAQKVAFWKTIISASKLSRLDILRDRYSKGVEKVSDRERLKGLMKLYLRSSQETVEAGKILIKDVKGLFKYAGKPIGIRVKKGYDSLDLSKEAFLPLKMLEKGQVPTPEERGRLEKFYDDISYRYILGRSIGKNLIKQEVIKGRVDWSGTMMVVGNELLRYATVCQSGWLDPRFPEKLKSPVYAKNGFKTAKECFERVLKLPQSSAEIKTRARERIKEINQVLEELK